MTNLEVGDIVSCIVEKIVGTIVFVNIEGDGQGSIIFSEIAPGRIRNIRDYVVPKKRIICKVLRITQDRVDLSFRRVTQKEQKEVSEQQKQEKSYKSILKSVLKEKSKEIAEKIQEKEKLFEFFDEAKTNPEELEKLVGKTDAKKILDILNTQKTKKAVLKKEFKFSTAEPNGLEKLKEILGNQKEVQIKYISAGKYSISTEADDLKKADQKITQILEEIESQAKKIDADFSVKEK